MANDTSHKSLEPLLNDSTIGTGENQFLGFTAVNSLGVGSNRANQAITDTAVEITIGAGKRTVYLQNRGANDIALGGSGVLTTTGIVLFPDQTLIFNNVQDDFSVYAVTVAGGSSLGVLEFA